MLNENCTVFPFNEIVQNHCKSRSITVSVFIQISAVACVLSFILLWFIHSVARSVRLCSSIAFTFQIEAVRHTNKLIMLRCAALISEEFTDFDSIAQALFENISQVHSYICNWKIGKYIHSAQRRCDVKRQFEKRRHRYIHTLKHHEWNKRILQSMMIWLPPRSGFNKSTHQTHFIVRGII